MKKLFTFLSRANNNSVGINSNYRRVSSIYSMLTLVAILLMLPQRVKAVEGVYDFSSQYDTQVSIPTNSSNQVSDYMDGNWPYYYFTKIGGISNPTRFASSYDGWSLVQGSGLKNNKNGVRKILISQLEKGEVVTIITNSGTVSLNSSSDECTDLGNQTYRMKEDGALIVDVSSYGVVQKITIAYQAIQNRYDYDPAIESYDLYWVADDATFTTDGSVGAGFPLDHDDLEAQYLSNISSGFNTNNRIAISQVTYNGTMTPWRFHSDTFNDRSEGLQSLSNWHNISICNLKEGDRVRIQFNGQAKFSSKAENMAYNGCAAFRDTYNNGDLMAREGDKEIECGMNVECPGSDGMSYYYTILEDGHLDIALSTDTRLYKVEIYSDHQATMIDRYNGSAATGYTAYFSSTGQLIAKEHIVPGGLEVHIGNEDNTQHAIVVSSDQGPVSFVYDQGHYKMARQESNSTNITNAPPATGTFYKFMPEVDGYLTVNYKAYNIKYNDYWNGNGLSQGNEVVATSGTCPYYIMVKDVNNNFGRYVHPNGTTQYAHDLSTGDNDNFENIRVTAGNTYYVYGWWSKDSQGRQPGTEGWEIRQSNCGVAQLIDVTFIPDNMVTPLAKWVATGTTSDDNLADVTGFTTNDLHIKMMSDNITSCEPYIEGDKLKIKNIIFANGENPGGTILIKLGSPSNDADPVFAYTIAYDASWQSSDWTDNSRSEGHTWDFSTNPLRGLKWDNTNSKFDVVDFGTETGPGLLYDEMHETNPDGTTHSDWTKTWRVIDHTGTGTHDLMFLNKYDMEGDNADMMWDTEGLIFNTSSNQSCINNEFGGVVDHSKIGTATDPDRYVGILPGGSFTIPALKEGDRVEIFMGSGDGSGANACKFNITGALDAIGQAISSSDIYNGGGSHWEQNMGNESRYRGAYQFISTGGDMTFTMNGGSMTKLYSIKIYHGVKTVTVDCTRQKNLTYDNEVYDGYTYSFVNDWRTTTPAKTAITLHYRGKGERLRKPTVVYKSGNISTGSDNLFCSEDGDDKGLYIFYKSKKEDYGMFRMRIEDLELGNKYVADYALQNITAGYLIKKNYPYTWDFTDLTGYVETDARITGERTNVDNYDPRTVDENETYEIEFMNNSVREGVKAVEQWKQYAADGDIPAGYGLHINNEPYGGGCMWAGGQLYANEQAFDETFGLSILPPLNSKGETDISNVHNGGVRICEEGLCLTGGDWRIMIPLVGGDKVASVYIRAKQVGSRTITAGVGDAGTAFTYVGTATDGTGDKIYAVKGTGDDMTLFFNNLIIKKIAISQDPKTVNKLGYATESRNVEIDPELMGYMTGTGLKAYTVTNVTYGDKAGDKASVTLTEIPSDNVMGPATAGDHRAYIIYNTDETAKAVNILDGGFHLFVPDMHDISSASNHKKSILETEEGKNHLRSHINSGSISQSEGNYTNYLMNYKYSDKDGQHEGPEAFYRAGKDATLGANKAYLQLLTEKVKPTDASFSKSFAIIFEDEFNSINPGITTVIDNASSNENVNENNIEWYNLNGQKLNGKPSTNGLYIINGKKIVVK